MDKVQQAKIQRQRIALGASKITWEKDNMGDPFDINYFQIWEQVKNKIFTLFDNRN